MSVSTEVQRTLVKSPPELWAELSSADRLGYHLGEVGEVRVTKVESECRVEWEANGAKGVVELEQSGWGTRVTLSLTRELPAAEIEAPGEPLPSEPLPGEQEPVAEASAEQEPVSEAEAAAEPAPEAEPTPTAAAIPEPVPEQPATVASEPASDAEPVADAPEPEPMARPIKPKQGFFSRLFKRRKGAEAQAEPAPIPRMQPEQESELPVELYAMALPEPLYPAPPLPVEPAEPAVDLGAELVELEAQLQQESTELLTGVLDRLGAAHHRPFSRA
jgi:hypothetical protein